MKRLDVAVVGYGVMGKYHASVYSAMPQTNLVAVVDPLANRRDEAQAEYAVAAFEDVDAMLSRRKIAAATVSAPTSVHARLTEKLLRAGVHVLVEKPAATSVNQAEYLASLSRRLGLILQVGHITRFYQAVQLLASRVTSPYLIEARRLTPNSRIKDVGVILDLMIHDIDIVLGLVAGDITDVTVAGHIINGSPFEDVAAAQITFSSGCIARFLASRIAPDAERTLVVAESERTFRLDFGKEPHTEMTVYRPKASSDGNLVQMDRTVVHEENPLRKELEHFLARIHGTTPPIGTLDDDLRSLRLAARLLARLAPTRRADALGAASY